MTKLSNPEKRSKLYHSQNFVAAFTVFSATNYHACSSLSGLCQWDTQIKEPKKTNAYAMTARLLYMTNTYGMVLPH